MASVYGATCHMNKPFSHIYSMDDPRFFFPTTPGSGSILYYSTLYDRFTASDANKFKWDPSTGYLTVENIEIPNNGNLRLGDLASNKLILTHDTGGQEFQMFPEVFDGSVFSWKRGGLIKTEGTIAGVQLYDRAGINFYTLLSTGNRLFLQYNGADTGVSFDTTGVLRCDGLEMLDQTNPLNGYKLLSTASVLKLQYNGGDTGITFDSTGVITGSLTGSATLIDTTLTTTNATFFVPFVPSSASQPNGQVLGTDGGLTYNPSNNAFEVLNGSITSDVFVGSLTGSATLIDTTLTTTNATFFVPFVPSSASQPNGQVLGTDGGLTYNPSNNAFEVLNGSITAPSINVIFEQTFTATTSTTCLNCFNSTFENYQIQIRFTTAPTAFSALLLQLASSAGIASTTNYQGAIATLGSFTSASHATSSFTLANLPSNAQITMSWILYNPNLARGTTITGTNPGSTSASFITVPQIVSGLHVIGTAFPSIVISCANNIAGVITVRGFN